MADREFKIKITSVADFSYARAELKRLKENIEAKIHSL